MTNSSNKIGDKPAIERCPICRYSLEGLPPVHRCPECAFEYDEETLVITDRLARKAHFLIVIFPLFMLFPRLLEVIRILHTGSPITVWFWLDVATLFIFVPVIGWLIHGLRYPPTAIVNPNGVLLLSGKALPTIYPWSEIADVTFHPKRKNYGVCFLICGEKNISLQPFMATRQQSQTFFLAVKAKLAAKNNLAELRASVGTELSND